MCSLSKHKYLAYYFVIILTSIMPLFAQQNSFIISNTEEYENERFLKEMLEEEGLYINEADSLSLIRDLGLKPEEANKIIIYRKTRMINGIEDLIKLDIYKKVLNKPAIKINYDKADIGNAYLRLKKDYYHKSNQIYLKNYYQNKSLKYHLIGNYSNENSNIFKNSALSIEYKNLYDKNNPVNKLIFGSFKINCGQGLVFGQASTNNISGVYDTNIETYSRATLSGENKTGGILSQITLADLKLITFFSKQLISVKLDSLNHILDLQNSTNKGLYEDAYIESFGQIIEKHYKNTIMGASYCRKIYPHPFLYKQYLQDNTSFSQYSQCDFKYVRMAYELAYGKQKTSFTGSLDFKLRDYLQKTEIRFKEKYFPKNYNRFSSDNKELAAIVNSFSLSLSNSEIIFSNEQSQRISSLEEDYDKYKAFANLLILKHSFNYLNISLKNKYDLSEDVLNNLILEKKRYQIELSMETRPNNPALFGIDIAFYKDYYNSIKTMKTGLIINNTYNLKFKKNILTFKTGIYRIEKSEWIPENNLPNSDYMRLITGNGRYINILFKQMLINHLRIDYFFNYQKDNNKNLDLYMSLNWTY